MPLNSEFPCLSTHTAFCGSQSHSGLPNVSISRTERIHILQVHFFSEPGMFPHCRAEKSCLDYFQLALKIYSLSFILPFLLFQRNTWLEMIILYYYILACYFNFLRPLAESLHLTTSCIGLLFLPLKGQIKIQGF